MAVGSPMRQQRWPAGRWALGPQVGVGVVCKGYSVVCFCFFLMLCVFGVKNNNWWLYYQGGALVTYSRLQPLQQPL